MIVVFRKRDRPPLPPEALAARRRLRRWYVWTGLALFPLDGALSGLWIAIPALLFLPGPDVTNEARLLFGAIVTVGWVTPTALYFLWTGFTVGWRDAPVHSVLLWLMLCLFNIAEAFGQLPNLPKESGQLAHMSFPEDILVFAHVRLDIPMLVALGVWLAWKRGRLGPTGVVAFQWCVFVSLIWMRHSYYAAAVYVIGEHDWLW